MAQLILRKRSTLLRAVLGKHGGFQLDDLPVSATTIEQLCVRDRDQVLRAATWLADEWPERFLRTSSEARLTAAHFSGAQHTLPENARLIVEQNLRRRHANMFSADDIHRTIENLSANGKSPTKSQIRATLGVSENSVLNQILYQRRHASRDELCRLIALFQDKLNHTPEARTQRVTLMRDMLMVIASAFLGKKVEEICAISRAELRLLLAEEKTENDRIRRDLMKQARLLNDQIPAPREGQLRFCSRFGKPLMAHGLRERVSKLMGNEFDKKLWRSVDVFQFSLLKPPQHAA